MIISLALYPSISLGNSLSHEYPGERGVLRVSRVSANRVQPRASGPCAGTECTAEVESRGLGLKERSRTARIYALKACTPQDMWAQLDLLHPPQREPAGAEECRAPAKLRSDQSWPWTCGRLCMPPSIEPPTSIKILT